MVCGVADTVRRCSLAAVCQTEFARQLAEQHAKLAAVYTEVEELRKENAMLKRLY